jgi:hypothetical protein
MMTRTEILLNAHIHSAFSDGSGTYEQILRDAAASNLDAILITDHNIHVWGREGDYGVNGKPLILLTGEEIHDIQRKPQKNHLLVFGVNTDISRFASDPQQLIDEVNRRGGLSFLAHPDDQAMPGFHQPEIDWVSREVVGFTGIELWNGLSELKFESKSLPRALLNILIPAYLPHGPNPATLQYWDSLLASGHKVPAIGGADAHALIKRLGSYQKVIFPYSYHFSAINNHLLLPEGLNDNLARDQKLIYQALRNGNSFIANDLYFPSRGFRFTAATQFREGSMGDEIQLQGGVTLQISLPREAECRLLCDGKVVRSWKNHVHCTYITKNPGIYRVEVYINALGAVRGWIFSNPIYIRG